MASTRTKLEGIPLIGIEQKISNAAKGQFLTSGKKSPPKAPSSRVSTAQQSKQGSPK